MIFNLQFFGTTLSVANLKAIKLNIVTIRTKSIEI